MEPNILKPVLYIKTCWAGKLFVRGKMIQAAGVADHSIYIAGLNGFRNDVNRFVNQLEEMH